MRASAKPSFRNRRDKDSGKGMGQPSPSKGGGVTPLRSRFLTQVMVIVAVNVHAALVTDAGMSPKANPMSK